MCITMVKTISDLPTVGYSRSGLTSMAIKSDRITTVGKEDTFFIGEVR